ncbi:hypothetical protein HX001_06530 [Empedobacter brevis]|uniref:Response regulatory domain-containing protein n=1 Tax=Empedobacter brevis TaxID=247 RepID=A0AAJ1QDQ2_9FLAO|nr:hypothetical protein [Empedobacter brevis]MDM1072150.1 hypothetical protein [Empedobacter brevis]
MFKILVVEDDSVKLRNILNSISKNCLIEPEKIDHELDSFSAKKRLKEDYYDLLIVDIAIPNKKSDKIDQEGGIKLIEEILQRDNIKTPAHIVGLTAIEEVFEKSKEILSSNIISVIRYSDTDMEWEEKLSTGIKSWEKAKSSILSNENMYNYDIVILTAVDVEFEAVKFLSSSWKRLEVTGDSTIYYETEFEEDDKRFRVVLSRLDQMGMVASSSLTMKLIYNFRPKYLFMPGIAASLKSKEDHGFGDVLVIDESWDGGSGKVEKDDQGNYVFKKNAFHLRLDSELSSKMRAIQENSILLREIKDDFRYGKKPNTELKIHIGSVVSVAGVIANEDIARSFVDQDRKLLGLEMEVYGAYFSANNCGGVKPKVLALKSICDFADSSKSDDYQNYAAYTSVKVMYEFIIKECEPV